MNADIFSLPGPRDPNACPLGICDGSGFVVDEATNTASDCRCRAGHIAKRRATGLEARLPKRYQGVSFDRPPVPEMPEPVVSAVRSYVRNIDARLDEGRGMWLVGDIGTGKTTLAMLVSKAAIEAGHTVAIYSLPRLLNLIRSAIETDEGMVSFLERLTAVDLLHIDDLGVENKSDWVLEQLYSIINTRYEDERAMILTTNLEIGELREQFGERTLSRLLAICGEPLGLFGQDERSVFRPKQAKGDPHARSA